MHPFFLYSYMFTLLCKLFFILQPTFKHEPFDEWSLFQPGPTSFGTAIGNTGVPPHAKTSTSSHASKEWHVPPNNFCAVGAKQRPASLGGSLFYTYLLYCIIEKGQHNFWNIFVGKKSVEKNQPSYHRNFCPLWSSINQNIVWKKNWSQIKIT